MGRPEPQKTYDRSLSRLRVSDPNHLVWCPTQVTSLNLVGRGVRTHLRASVRGIVAPRFNASRSCCGQRPLGPQAAVNSPNNHTTGTGGIDCFQQCINVPVNCVCIGILERAQGD